MTCSNCDNNEALDIEEYCHMCGDHSVCFDCLEREWCPRCIKLLNITSQNSNQPQKVKIIGHDQQGAEIAEIVKIPSDGSLVSTKKNISP